MVSILKLPSIKSWDKIGMLFSTITKNKTEWGNLANKINKLAGVLSVEDCSKFINISLVTGQNQIVWLLVSS